MRRALTLLTAVAVAAGVMVGSAGSAFADPSTTDWRALRTCESGDNYSTNTGNGYYGAYQFDLSTWKSVGGSGYPHQASKSEQDSRALALYRQRGWSPWICAALVGLTEDSDGGSGVKPSVPAPSGGSGSTGGSGSGGSGSSGSGSSSSNIPVFPGNIYNGRYSASLKTFQLRLEVMGYGSFDGTGWLGTKTRSAVKKLQKKAHLAPTGDVGASTWKAAWNTKYSLKRTATPAKPSTSAAPTYPGTVRFGEYSVSLKKLQTRLGVMGYGSFDGTGWYGAKTRAGIIALQKKAGLKPATGIITAQTWKAAWNSKYKKSATVTAGSSGSASYVPATNASCKVGSRSPLPWGGKTMVPGKTYRDLQCFQRALGSAYGLTGTGYFGPTTRAAVAKLQAKAGLPKTGKVDSATWKAAWTKK